MKDPNADRPGFKKTKVGWIPHDWACVPMGDGIDLVSGQHVDAEYCSDTPGGTPYLTGPTCFQYGRVIRCGYTSQPLKLCGANDTLVTVKGSGTGTVARADREYCISRQIMAAKAKGWSQEFIYMRFLRDARWFGHLSDGLIPGISREDILKHQIPLPPLPEQKKIAETLSAWDEAIEQTRKLIDAKKHRKKGLMQQLLTGKKHLPNHRTEKWQTKAMGDLVKPVCRPVPRPSKPYISTGIRSHGKGTFSRIVEDPSKVAMDMLYQIEAGDLIVNITFAWEGAVAIVSEADAAGLVSHRFPTYQICPGACDLEYLRQLIRTRRFVWDLGLISPGGAGRNRVLNKTDFLKMKVMVPNQPVQHEIGQVLATADEELRDLEAEL